MNQLAKELHFRECAKVSEKRSLMSPHEYGASVLCISEKTYSRRKADLAFDVDQWRRAYEEFGESILTAFCETIRNHTTK